MVCNTTKFISVQCKDNGNFYQKNQITFLFSFSRVKNKFSEFLSPTQQTTKTRFFMRR